MKEVLRPWLWESNSSSSHTLSIIPKKIYDKWCEGELYLDFDDEKSKLFTRDEVIKDLAEQLDTTVQDLEKHIEEEYYEELYFEEYGYMRYPVWTGEEGDDDGYWSSNVNFYKPEQGEEIAILCRYSGRQG